MNTQSEQIRADEDSGLFWKTEASGAKTISVREAQAIVDANPHSAEVTTTHHCPDCGDADGFAGDSIYGPSAYGEEIQGMPCDACEGAPLIVCDGQYVDGKKIVEDDN